MNEPAFNQPIVIDNGTFSSKVGFAGEDQPRSVFPSLIGFPQDPTIFVRYDPYMPDYYVGEMAHNLRGVLDLKYPIDCGQITDRENIEKKRR